MLDIRLKLGAFLHYQEILLIISSLLFEQTTPPAQLFAGLEAHSVPVPTSKGNPSPAGEYPTLLQPNNQITRPLRSGPLRQCKPVSNPIASF
jgi:hypothetical protein